MALRKIKQGIDVQAEYLEFAKAISCIFLDAPFNLGYTFVPFTNSGA